ncbi:MAG: aldo/keto reductase [Pseudomonadota bacterium]
MPSYRSSLTPITLGTWGLGDASNDCRAYHRIDPETAINVIIYAIDKGINFFDTAPAYGNGNSEIRLGQAIQKTSTQPLVSTKAGWPNFANPPDYSNATILKNLSQSIERIGYVDMLMLHLEGKINTQTAKNAGRLLEELKKSKMLNAIGVACKAPADLKFWCDYADWDIASINFNMLDLRAIEHNIFELAKRYNIDLVCRTPLAMGFLAQAYPPQHQFAAHDIRSSFNSRRINSFIKGAKIAMKLAQQDDIALWPLTAVRFCLSFKAIKSVIVGSCSINELKAYLPALDGLGLSDEVVQKIIEANIQINPDGHLTANI